MASKLAIQVVMFNNQPATQTSPYFSLLPMWHDNSFLYSTTLGSILLIEALLGAQTKALLYTNYTA
jgi:hypothetical protein